ncbi:hypothetical protein JCM15765_14350 [Paradesulfitobacterium aromaticivorans]
MGRKIFVSYKYADSNVKDITGAATIWNPCTVRNYVDELEGLLKDKTEHIYKGESDGEDLSQLSDATIWNKLKNRIYDSTLTIVMLSKGMRDQLKVEKYQWIPQEISYSLKEISRTDSSGRTVTSKTNALLALVVPDTYGSYSYFTEKKSCCSSGCTFFNNTSNLIFTIMGKNMFNEKKPTTDNCDSGSTIYRGDYNYMLCAKWDDFKGSPDYYIDKAYEIQDKQDNYDIRKEI